MLRAICGIALLVAASLPLHAEEAKPNTLTPKEIEEGWILLFDGETTFGWTGKAIDKWTIAEGVLYPQKGTDAAIVHGTPWNAFELVFQYQVKKNGKGQVIIGGDGEGGESETGKLCALSR